MADRIDILLAEYKEVYAEVRQALVLQYSALGVGLAFIAAIVKEAASSYDRHELISAMLLLSIPFWVLLTLFAWIGEVARMRRGSIYLSAVEASMSLSFNREHPRETFGFHTWLLSSEGQPQLKINYIIIALALVLIGAGSLLLVGVLAWNSAQVCRLAAPAVIVAVIFSCGTLGVAIRLWRINTWRVAENLLADERLQKLRSTAGGIRGTYH